MGKFLIKQKGKLIAAFLAIAFIVTVIFISVNRAEISRQDELASLPRTKVTSSSLEEIVFASGVIEAANQSKILSPSSGEVSEVLVGINQYVLKDQIILKLKSRNQFNREITTEIKAPINGNIVRLEVKVSDQIIQGQTILAEIADFDSLLISATAAEADVSKLELGQEVSIDIKSLGDFKRTGKISFVSLTPIPLAATYPFKVALDESIPNSRLGLSANLEVKTKEINAEAVIDDSFFYRRDGKFFVQRIIKPVDEQTGQIELEEVEIVIGFRGENKVEIISGLEVGNELILPNDQFSQRRSRLNFFGGS